MNYLQTVLVLVIFTVCTGSLTAQKTAQDKIVSPKQLQAEKPRLFAALPEKFNVDQTIITDLFSTRSTEISVPVAHGLSLDGTIVEKVQQNPNVVSLNIRIKNYDNSLLNISRITESDLSVSYIARVINIKSGDVLLLRNENGQFYFTKEKQSLIAVE